MKSFEGHPTNVFHKNRPSSKNQGTLIYVIKMAPMKPFTHKNRFNSIVGDVPRMISCKSRFSLTTF